MSGDWVAAAIALVLASCQAPLPPPEAPAVPPEAGDLLHDGRKWRREQGLMAARNRLSAALAALDASHGRLENRVMRTNRERDHVYPDSLAAQSVPYRNRTGIYLVLGFGQDTGEAAETLHHLAEWMSRAGWRARVVPLDPWAPPQQQAAAIDRFLRYEVPNVDRVLMAGFSMGANLWIRWIAGHSAAWPPLERAKFGQAVFFAGAFRGAALARWMNESRSLEAGMGRTRLRMLDLGSGGARRAIAWAADDPWAGREMPSMEEILPGLKVVQYVTLPDGSDGLPGRQFLLRCLARPVTRDMAWMGPFDGMVESGSQVLPPGDRTPQSIIRVFSSHGMTEGYYPNGSDVSRAHGKIIGARAKAGEDMLDDLMRALPAFSASPARGSRRPHRPTVGAPP